MNATSIFREDIIALLSVAQPGEVQQLFDMADDLRSQCVGDAVHVRGIIEISNRCACNCLYCGLRAGNRSIPRYAMHADEIIDRALLLLALPVRTIVLQSGEDSSIPPEDIARVIRTLKRTADAAITLSLGIRSEDEYSLWFDAGADRYLLKHETANPGLFKRHKPDSDFEERIKTLVRLGKIGFQIGTGNMIGLPGQTIGDIADDILLCRELEADMCTFGPFIPSPYTPLAGEASGSVGLSLKTIAVARIALRDVHIPANTALGILEPDARRRALLCGANVIMPNFTPLQYRGQYQIYPKEIPELDDIAGTYSATCEMIAGIGRRVGHDRGDSIKGH